MHQDGVQPADLKRVGKAEPKVYVHKDGKTIMIPAEKKDEYMAKGYKLSSLRAEGVMSSYGQYLEMEFKKQNKYKDIGDFEASPEFQALIQQHPVFKDKGQTEDDNSSRGMNKYGLAARNKDGKFYSYQNGKLTGTFDNMKDLQKHQQQIVQQMDDKHNQESTNEDLAQMAQKVEQDHEVQMARSDLYKAAKYSIKLHDRLKNISEEEGLEGWVAAKITKASDYLCSVYHYMDYEMMSQESYLPEGWVDDLRKLGARGLDKMKALYDPATAAKVKADDMAKADAGTMFNDIVNVHAMNQQGFDGKNYDNNTVVAYLKKFIEPRNPQAFLDLSKDKNSNLERLFPTNGKMTKQELQGNLRKIGQVLQKVDLTPDAPQQGEPQGEPVAASIDYKESISKKFQAKLDEVSKKKTEPVLEDFVGKPITEEEFEKLAEKQDACYHKVKARYKVWPSAYASGALVQCRKKGAANWGNKSKK